MARKANTAHALAACIGEGGRLEEVAREVLRAMRDEHNDPHSLAARLGVSTRQVHRLLVGLNVAPPQPWKANKPRAAHYFQCRCSACRRAQRAA